MHTHWIFKKVSLVEICVYCFNKIILEIILHWGYFGNFIEIIKIILA